METKSKTKATISDTVALLRAKTPLLWVVTREEGRVERYLAEAALAAGFVPQYWDCVQGFTDVSFKPVPYTDGANDAGTALDYVNAAANAPATGSKGSERYQTLGGQYVPFARTVTVLRDFHVWVNGPVGTMTVRRLRNLAKTLPRAARDRAQAVIILSPDATIPQELQGHATIIDWPLPDRFDIAKILDASLAVLSGDDKAKADPAAMREQAIDAAVGLSGDEVLNCYSKSLVQFRKIDPVAVASEKKRVVTREKVLTWHDPLPGGMDSVGGLEVMKAWLVRHRNAYSPEARAYGLPAPRGVLLIGVPGCGKSLTAKAVSTFYQCPLLQMDMGALKSKFVGESEGNLRKAFKVIESVGRCVVWIDEIEKALQGATQGSADGGVSADALGAVLSFMQERQGDAFVIATANDASSLPPELLRKGRFDEIFFVDLPTKVEREAVLAAALRQHGRDPDTIDLSQIAAMTKGYTGAEMASLVPDALFRSYEDGARRLMTTDLMAATQGVVPLAVTAAEKVAKLRAWAKGRARNASASEGDAIDGNDRTMSFDSVMTIDARNTELDAA